MVAVGKQRSPGIVILLCVVTLGVYWWVWQWKAFGEFERTKGIDLRRANFLVPLILLWLVSLGVVAVALSEGLAEFFRQAEGSAAPASPMTVEFGPLQFAALGLAILLYGLQAAFHSRVTRAVAQATPPGTNPPNATFAILFNVLFMFGNVPYVGGLFAVGGIVLAILWIVQIQGALNRIMMLSMPAPSPMSFTPQPMMR